MQIDKRFDCALIRRALSTGMLINPIAHPVIAEILQQNPALARVLRVNFRRTHVVRTQPLGNEQKRLRVGGLEVRITVSDDIARSARMARCKTLFEDFCVVTGSIREGIPVAVEVVDEAGDVLHRGV